MHTPQPRKEYSIGPKPWYWTQTMEDFPFHLRMIVPGIGFLVNTGFPMLQFDTRGFQSATLTLQNFQHIHAAP